MRKSDPSGAAAPSIQHWKAIAGVLMVFVAAAFILNTFVLTPTYESYAVVNVSQLKIEALISLFSGRWHLVRAATLTVISAKWALRGQLGELAEWFEFVVESSGSLFTVKARIGPSSTRNSWSGVDRGRRVPRCHRRLRETSADKFKRRSELLGRQGGSLRGARKPSPCLIVSTPSTSWKASCGGTSKSWSRTRQPWRTSRRWHSLQGTDSKRS